MLLSEGQMSDYKGAALMLTALPNAKELLGDKGYDADWFARLSPNVKSQPASRQNPIAKNLSNMTLCSTVSATKSRICLAGSRTGDVSTPVTTDAHIPSCQQSASQPSSSSGYDQ